MRSNYWVLRLSFLIILGMIVFSPIMGATTDERKQVDAAIARVKPALVRIYVVNVEYYDGREMKEQSAGSGVIISSDGYVVTNHHVVGKTTRITCTLSDKEEIPAELVGTDALADIAVIKLKPTKPRVFANADFGDSSKIQVGEKVLALGSPMALSQSVTEGIISNTEVVMPRLFGPFSKFTLDGEDVGSIVRWIGHDAEIIGGNSGGPLINLKGEIIGINEMSMGLAGAIPGNLAKSVAESIIKNGKVKRAWLGLEIQPRFKSSPVTQGALIGGIIMDSPAQKAGLQSGDYLIEMNNEPVNLRFDEEIPLFNIKVSNLPIQQEVKIKVLRNNQPMELKIIPVEREEMRPKTYELKRWGICGRNISFMAAKEMKITNRDGVLITSIRSGGPANEAKPSINERCIIREVNGVPVHNVQELIDLTNKLDIKENEQLPVLVSYDQRNERRMTVVKIGSKEIEDHGSEIRKAWIPINYQVLTRDLAEHIGLSTTKGVIVTEVFPGTAAESCGLKIGDIITHIDQSEINASQPEDYDVMPTMVRQIRVGTVITLGILRQKTPLDIKITLPRSPAPERELAKYKDDVFEFSVRDLGFYDRMKEKLEDKTSGVIVTEVKEGGWAALAQLSVDDIILEVNQKPVNSLDALKSLLETFAKEKIPSVIVKVQRGIHTQYLEIEPKWDN